MRMDGSGTVYDIIDLGFDATVARRAVVATNNVRFVLFAILIAKPHSVQSHQAFTYTEKLELHKHTHSSDHDSSLILCFCIRATSQIYIQ